MSSLNFRWKRKWHTLSACFTCECAPFESYKTIDCDNFGLKIVRSLDYNCRGKENGIRFTCKCAPFESSQTIDSETLG